MDPLALLRCWKAEVRADELRLSSQGLRVGLQGRDVLALGVGIHFLGVQGQGVDIRSCS